MTSRRKAAQGTNATLGVDDVTAVYQQVNQPEAGGVVYAVQHGDQFVYVYEGPTPYQVAVLRLDPKPPPQELVDRAPSWLLAARYEVVAFAGRTRELGDLRSWRDTPGSEASVLLVHGPGGQGKTRLAAQFAQESAAAGWTVAAALHRSDPASSAKTGGTREELRVDGHGLLLVVDYAERWPGGDLLALITSHQRAAGGRVRVLLLARPAGTWWHDLAYRLTRAGITDADQLLLTALAARPQERAGLFTEAAAAFAPYLGMSDPAQVVSPRDLERDSAYGLVLTIHMAALAAVEASRRGQSPPPDARGLSGYVLDRERDHWAVLHEARRITTTPAMMGHTVYTATLTRALGHDDAVYALNRADVASDPASATITLGDHAVCYPPADPAMVLEPLYPDRLAEDFLALSTPGHSSEYPADAWAVTAAERLLAPAPDRTVPGWTRGGLAILIETAARWPHVASGVLYPLLAADPALALTAGGAALTRLADLPGIDLALLEAIEAHLPSGRHVDLDPAAAVITISLHAHRLASATGDAERAHLYANLGYRLANASRPDEALAAAAEGTEIYRRLATARPDAFEPDLATSLNNLGNRLSEVGQRDEALAATAEGTEIYRRLATARPDAFEPNLATSLNNLGDRLSRLGSREEAAAAAAEATEIYRRLATARPDAFEPDLAMSLTNLGAFLSGVGQRDEALAATAEATEIYRRLATARPDAFEPNLATSLSNLGASLSEVGSREEAAAAAAEATEIYRRLATARPDAFEPNLATSLSNLGASLSEVGSREEAAAAAAEATEIYRRLATARPDAFEPNLARSLSNLGAFLSGVGQRDEALAATAEATEIHRRLATARPDAFEPNLADTLGNLGNRLSEVGQREEAAAAAAEATEIFRRLATARPDAFEPYLAMSLNNLGALSSGVETAAATAEAAEIFRRLATARPDAFEPYLAGTLGTLGIGLAEVGRREEALDAAAEATEIYRRLATAQPDAFEPNLARSLWRYAWLRVAGKADLSEALTAAEEAVTRFEALATRMPLVFNNDLAGALITLADVLGGLDRGAAAAAVRRRAGELGAA